MKKNILSNNTVFWETAKRFINRYLPEIRRASNHTVASYRDGLNIYISYLSDFKGVKLKNISYGYFSAEYVKHYQDWLLNIKNNSPKTSNLRLTAIRSFMEYSANEYPELLPQYVCICGIKDSNVTARKIEFFEKRQMKAMLDAPDISSKTGRRNQMILILLYDTGARVSELLDLTVGSLHMNSATPYVTLHGKGDKYRNVPLMQKTVKHLERYLKEFHEEKLSDVPLFYATMHGKKHGLSHDTMEKLIDSCVSVSINKGIEMPERCSCHMIRKTRAMDLYQSGVPLTHIQQLLGHEDISTTTGFYAFATLDTLQKSMSKADATNNDESGWKDPNILKKLYSL